MCGVLQGTGRCTETKSKSTGQAWSIVRFDEKTYIVFNAPRLEPLKNFMLLPCPNFIESLSEDKKLEATILTNCCDG